MEQGQLIRLNESTTQKDILVTRVSEYVKRFILNFSKVCLHDLLNKIGLFLVGKCFHTHAHPFESTNFASASALT